MIKHALIAQITLIIIFGLFTGCGDSIEDPDAPAPPVWVGKSAPTDTIATGIRPYNNGNGIILEWHPNLEDDISGYKLYKAEQDIENRFTLAVDLNAFSVSGADTFFVDDSVKFCIDYYYYLRAYDQAGNKSDPSDTIQYAVISKVEPLQPTGTLTAQPTIFEWNDFSNLNPEYVIWLENFETHNVIWISRFTTPNYGDFCQSKNFNFDSLAEPGTLSSGQRYRWCIKSITYVDPHTNIDIGGSVSNWIYFTIE
ncbi:MAG TPA: hypothetical protein DHW42_06270 [Candidatus Marinimicrobia bacterium]|nr:hypothetical protein [Candidatus Neomarinimicrobiota bacterium]